MRYTPTIFSELVEPLDRRRFDAIVARHDGDAYDKSFFSWNHLMALIYAQLSELDSLRALEAGWNANSQHHYHLGCGAWPSSTLADANRRRPVAVFIEAFELVAGLLDRHCRNDGQRFPPPDQFDPHPVGKAVPLGQVQRPHPRHESPRRLRSPSRSAASPRHHRRQRQRRANRPHGRQSSPAATYVFDKGYLPLWMVDRNPPIQRLLRHPSQGKHGLARADDPVRSPKPQGDGFTVLADEEVVLSSKGDSKLPIPLRRIRILRDNGKVARLLTNDMKRSAVEIGETLQSAAGRSSCCSDGSSSISRSASSSAATKTRSSCRSTPP